MLPGVLDPNLVIVFRNQNIIARGKIILMVARSRARPWPLVPAEHWPIYVPTLPKRLRWSRRKMVPALRKAAASNWPRIISGCTQVHSFSWVHLPSWPIALILVASAPRHQPARSFTRCLLRFAMPRLAIPAQPHRYQAAPPSARAMPIGST